MLKRTLFGFLTAAAFALPAAAQDYVVGVTGALTGPPSSTYAPAVDAMRIYIDRVNAAGGKTISPSQIENALRASPYVAEAVVFGHGRKYLTAIVEIGRASCRERVSYHV